MKEIAEMENIPYFFPVVYLVSKFDWFQYDRRERIWPLVFVFVKFYKLLWKMSVISFGDNFFEILIISIRIGREISI